MLLEDHEECACFWAALTWDAGTGVALALAIAIDMYSKETFQAFELKQFSAIRWPLY